MGIGRIGAALFVVFVVGCQSAPSVSPGPSVSPATDPSTSSQAIIAADLEAGLIDEGTSYQYRAWALFGDPRLPEKYDGSGSLGEDNGLFDQIADSLETLPDAQAADLERFLLRPSDARSAWSSAPGEDTAADSTGVKLAAVRVAQEDDETQLCSAPQSWFSKDWSPDGSADLGFRVWACGASEATTRADLDAVVGVASRAWLGLTFPEPDGMGLPVSDKGARANDGNGKVDVYLVEPLAECRLRGTQCAEIPGHGVAAAFKDPKDHCPVAGFSDRGCSGYMVLGRGRLGTPSFAADFAHEFFHVLQMAHNADVDITWYHEASAVWAEFAVERESSEPDSYGWYRLYQGENRSLLHYDYNSNVQYRAWGWPLFQAIDEGPSNVFVTWQQIESSLTRSDVDRAVNAQLDFAASFRDFAVRNAQPAAYIFGSSKGLDDDRWQTKEDLADFPQDPHRLSAARSTLSLGKSKHPASIDPLTAQHDEYEVVGEEIRQIEIDLSKLKNAGFADLDALAQIRSQSGDNWTRFQGRGGKLKLCRDIDAENVDTVLHLVISNHDFTRSGNLPDTSKAVTGNYEIETKDECDERDLHIGGRITWEATATEQYGDPPQTKSVSGSMDVVLHVITPYLIQAEREDHSTYSYDYTSNNELCPSSHEEGTVESYAGVGTTEDWDYSIGNILPGGPLGQDMSLLIILSDYCGPSMGGDVVPGPLGIQGFPDCEPGGDQLFARFDGVENYVIDCDEVVEFGGITNDFGVVTGHVSGTLRPLDGPHPTPPY